MPDGTTIVVSDGVITEIRPATDDTTDDTTDDGNDGDTSDDNAAALAEANATIASLRAELEQAKALAKTEDELRILNLVAVAGGESWLKSAKSNYKPAASNKTPGKPAAPVKKSLVQKRLEEMDAKNNA